MRDSFVGWTPTVSGALSFAAYGDVSHPPRSKNANRTDGATRYLIAYRAKDYSDVLLPFRTLLGPLFFGLRGKLWFLCVARSDADGRGDQQLLRGNVFIFHDRTLWRDIIEPRVRTVQVKLRSFRYGVDASSLSNYFEADYASLLAACPGASAFNAAFEVTRTGITTIYLDHPMITAPTAPALPTVEPSRSHITHILTSQIFFFLRDIGHRHQHMIRTRIRL